MEEGVLGIRSLLSKINGAMSKALSISEAVSLSPRLRNDLVKGRAKLICRLSRISLENETRRARIAKRIKAMEFLLAAEKSE